MTESQTPEAAPVRVPNVSPGARSGLDHEVIGANVQEAYAANLALTDSESAAGDDFDATWSTDDQVSWVAAAHDSEEAGRRADAVYGHHRESGDTDEALGDLARRLTTAVHGEVPDDEDALLPEVPQDRTSVEQIVGWVNEGGDDRVTRARAALAAEEDREGGQRSTLVEPLQHIVDESQDS